MDLSLSAECPLKQGCSLNLTVFNPLGGDATATLSIPNKYGRMVTFDYIPLGIQPGHIVKMLMLPLEDSVVILTEGPDRHYRLWSTSDYIHFWEEKLPEIAETLDLKKENYPYTEIEIVAGHRSEIYLIINFNEKIQSVHSISKNHNGRLVYTGIHHRKAPATVKSVSFGWRLSSIPKALCTIMYSSCTDTVEGTPVPSIPSSPGTSFDNVLSSVSPVGQDCEELLQILSAIIADSDAWKRV